MTYLLEALADYKAGASKQITRPFVLLMLKCNVNSG